MKKTFMPDFKTKEVLETFQLEGLKWTVSHAYNGSAFYRERLDAAGVKPDDIKGLDDLKRLPFVTAQDLQEQYPY
ncbi:MAG: phenylacetate--CoA ligase family protein, partial [Syntrophobacterales bacterium]